MRRPHRINRDPGNHIKYVNTSKQIAGILTKGSFSRERWSQLTHLFNLVAPHMHTNSHLSVLFSSVQNDDKMSKRQAEPFADAPHSASSSSSSNVNPCGNEPGAILRKKRTDWTRTCKNRNLSSNALFKMKNCKDPNCLRTGASANQQPQPP